MCADSGLFKPARRARHGASRRPAAPCEASLSPGRPDHRLPLARRRQRRPLRQPAAPAEPQPARGRADRHPLCGAAGTGTSQSRRSGVFPGRWPGPECDQPGRRAGLAAWPPGPAARPGVCRPAWHRPQRAAALRRRRTARRPAPAERAGRCWPARGQPARLPPGPASLALRRSAPVHHRAGDGRRGRRAPGAGRAAHQPDRGLIWHPGRPVADAAVSGHREARGAGRRGPARHGPAADCGARQPGHAARLVSGLHGRARLPAALPAIARAMAGHAGSVAGQRDGAAPGQRPASNAVADTRCGHGLAARAAVRPGAGRCIARRADASLRRALGCLGRAGQCRRWGRGRAHRHRPAFVGGMC